MAVLGLSLVSVEQGHGPGRIRQDEEESMEIPKIHCSVLVGVDGSDASHHAAAQAVFLARDLGAKLYAVYVVDTHTARTLGIYMRDALHELREDGRQVLNRVTAQAQDLGVGVEAILAEGRPGEEICRVAAEQKADIIVVGAIGKSAVEEILLGSVSEYVLHHAKQPVMVVRSR